MRRILNYLARCIQIEFLLQLFRLRCWLAGPGRPVEIEGVFFRALEVEHLSRFSNRELRALGHEALAIADEIREALP